MAMEMKETARGFRYVEFKDVYDAVCTIQKSSLATMDCLWIGMGDNRMHLSQDMVREILPALQHFVETGELS